MKILFCFLAAVSALLLAHVPAILADNSTLVPYYDLRATYSPNPATSTTPKQIVASLPGQSRAVSIYDSSGQVLQLLVGPSPAPSPLNFLVFPGGQVQYTPVSIQPGTPVWVKGVSGNATSGELDINFFQ